MLETVKAYSLLSFFLCGVSACEFQYQYKSHTSLYIVWLRPAINSTGRFLSGFYNRTLGEWVASKNGRVVKVLDDYNLDVTGTNSAASEADRLELGSSNDRDIFREIIISSQDCHSFCNCCF